MSVGSGLKMMQSIYFTCSGPPGPTGIPSKNQMSVNSVHTIVKAIEYGIRLESRVPSFMFYHTFEHKITTTVGKASLV